jgi:hypothetical protein
MKQHENSLKARILVRIIVSFRMRGWYTPSPWLVPLSMNDQNNMCYVNIQFGFFQSGLIPYNAMGKNSFPLYRHCIILLKDYKRIQITNSIMLTACYFNFYIIPMNSE